jgi:hypothetical protein
VVSFSPFSPFSPSESSLPSLSSLPSPSPSTNDLFADAAGRHVSSAGRDDQDGQDEQEWRWRLQGRSMGLAEAMRGEYGWLLDSSSLRVNLLSDVSLSLSLSLLSFLPNLLARLARLLSTSTLTCTINQPRPV